MRGIPKKTTLLWVVLAVLFTAFILSRIIRSRIGRAFIAIREDETAADSMGINSTYYKTLCFGVGAFFAGLGGGLFAHYMRYLNPNSFGFMRSIEHLCMVVLGGLNMGRLYRRNDPHSDAGTSAHGGRLKASDLRGNPGADDACKATGTSGTTPQKRHSLAGAVFPASAPKTLSRRADG